MTTGETIALTRWTFVGKIMSLLFNMLSKFVIAFLPRSKPLLINPAFLILMEMKNSKENLQPAARNLLLSSNVLLRHAGHLF